MKHGTVCFLRRDDEVMLILIEYSETNRKWGGVGGMVDPHESIEAAVTREMQEELGITVDKAHLKKMAVVEENPEFHLHVYFTNTWSGDMKPLDPSIKQIQWFVPATVPYEQMWPDNKYWLPEVLQGKKIKARVFKDVYHDIKPLTEKDVELREVAEFE